MQDDPAFDAALGHALLTQVARREREPGLRLFRPRPGVEFGRLDSRRPGFAAAVDAARRHGYPPVLRMVGGQAAAHDEGSLVLELFTTDGFAIDIHDRFVDATARLARALQSLGADARVGPIAGEYCPGEYSINVGGRVKVAGLAQRVVKGAALVSALVVVDGGARIRAVLTDVYGELGVEFVPATAGALADELPGVAMAAVERAVRDAFPEQPPVVPDDATRALALDLVERHRV